MAKIIGRIRVHVGSVIGGWVLATLFAPAQAMMGTEGPPPCEDAECFAEKVASCSEGSTYLTRRGAGATAVYGVEGPEGDGHCRVGMNFIRHPDSDWTYKPMRFVVNPQAPVEPQIKRAVEECLQGREGEYRCSGPLFEMISTPMPSR